MGEAAARKVTEIEDARQHLEADLKELEERLPSAVRSIKSLVGILVGSAFLAFLVRRRRSGRSERAPAAEVVVRVVREDREPSNP